MRRTLALAFALIATLPSLSRAQDPPAAPTPLGKDAADLVAGANRFGLELYAQLRARPGNLCASPHGIVSALAMVYAGANTQTARQMSAMLHYPDAWTPPRRIADGSRAINAALTPPEKNPPAGQYELILANAMWAQTGEDFLKEYLIGLHTDYGAGLTEVDFLRQPKFARDTINAGVRKQTRDKIAELIPPDGVGPDTRLVLTNALYFKGQWVLPFKPESTQDADFTIPAGLAGPGTAAETVKAPLMHRMMKARYLMAGMFRALDLPYVGAQRMSLTVLLPSEPDGLPGFEKDWLNDTNVKAWLKDLDGQTPQNVDVFLPRFRMTAAVELADALAALGMKDAFQPGAADFSGMNGKRDLFLSRVIHQCWLDVNEEGTEAAAGTAAVAVAANGHTPPTFRADHPFVFLIREQNTGAVLFLGRVVKP